MNHDESADQRPGDDAAPPGVRTMAVVRWMLVAAMALVAVAAIVGVVGGHAGASGHTHNQVYYCPMHPQIIRDRPGECPICGMTLVLKLEGTAAAPARSGPPAGEEMGKGVPGLVDLELDPRRVQKIGIKTARAERTRLPDTIRTVGVVEASERGRVQVAPRFGGWIEELFAAETGQRVGKGQTLATIYSPDLLAVQYEFLTALAWKPAADDGQASASALHPGHVEVTNTLAADARRRLALFGVDDREIDAIARDGKAHPTVAIRAPVSGHVIAKAAMRGLAVQAGTPLFEIADLSSVWVVADIYEADSARVRLGAKAGFTTQAYPGQSFDGKITFVYPVVDAAARTLRVRLELRNGAGPAGLKLRPGMYGDVTIVMGAGATLAVPAEAAIDTGDAQYVFIARDGGRYEPVAVKFGARRAGVVEVLAGLKEGDEVVTTANFLLDSESRLQATVNAPQGHEHR